MLGDRVDVVVEVFSVDQRKHLEGSREAFELLRPTGLEVETAILHKAAGA
jgi:hypothetical protein